MGYQALLFCPDEKTARVVTQVLNELEFSVEPANEPFAAVKRLTTQHFDAVVVDCENEQNAALLFKSARNSGPNRTSLAVAVVEGQPGIAKAFRIGANLVLTKPINIEQSKGTLRVARGLLKKPDGPKPAAATSQAPVAPVKPLATTPRPLMPAPTSLKPAVPLRPITTPQAPVVRAEAPSTLELEADPTPRTESTDAALLESMPDPVTPPPTKGATLKTAPWPPATSGKPFAGNTSPGQGAAFAPARETPQRSDTLEPKPAVAFAPAESARPAAHAHAESHPAVPSFGAHEKPASGSNQKWIFIAAVLLLAAAGGYFGWSKLNHSASAPATTAPPVQSTPVQSVPAPQAATATSKPAAQPPVSAAPQPQAVSAVQNNEPDTTPDDAANDVTVRKSAATPKPQSSGTAEKPAHDAVVMKGTTSKSAAAQNDANAPAPLIGMTSNSGDKALAGIMDSAPSARTPVLRTMKISQGVSQGLVIKKVSPDYPAQARQLRIEGTVQLDATIGRDGSVTNLKVLGGHPILARAAMDAVKQWKYKPYLLNGQAVEIDTQITVNFKLP